VADPDTVLDTDTPLQAIYKELDLDDRLLAVGGLTNAEVAQDLKGALDYIRQGQAGNDDEADTKAIVLQELTSEVDLIDQQDSNAAADPSAWPRQRNAIERAYQFDQGNSGVIAANAATSQAKADALNNILGKVGDAAKTAGGGLENILTIVLVIAVLLVLANFTRKT
jgi:hypothetical protein